MRYILIFISFLYSLYISTEPWFDNDILLQKLQNDVTYLCKENTQYYGSSPTSYYDVYYFLDSIDSNDPKCRESINALESFINFKFLKKQQKVGIKSQVDKLHIQEKGDRYYENDILYYSQSDVIKNFSYKIQISNSGKDTFFDESYISYKFKNDIYIKLGKYNRWWSPSKETSLIMSNSARPIPTFSVSSYKDITPKLNIFKFIGQYNFELSLSKLERNRFVPNAILFGNRFTFEPFNNLDLSLLRVAQFGGSGRTINTAVIKNMILGKDTTNSRLSSFEQPGNQIAGIDFSYRIPKNSNIQLYGQLMGEDGLDPIIDDRWIGAIFPSKRFGLIGISYFNKSKIIPWVINFEHINTDTGFKNVTYNHSIYKDGYRYKKLPIGASIDGDSHNSIVSFTKNFGTKLIKIKYQKMDLNQNLSEYSRFDENIINDQISVNFQKKINKDFLIDITFVHRNVEKKHINSNIIFLKLEQSL